jgi:hypothetical protein
VLCCTGHVSGSSATCCVAVPSLQEALMLPAVMVLLCRMHFRKRCRVMTPAAAPSVCTTCTSTCAQSNCCTCYCCTVLHRPHSSMHLLLLYCAAPDAFWEALPPCDATSSPYCSAALSLSLCSVTSCIACYPCFIVPGRHLAKHCCGASSSRFSVPPAQSPFLLQVKLWPCLLSLLCCAGRISGSAAAL